MACTGGNHVDQYGRVLKYHVLEPCARELLGVRKGRSVAMLCIRKEDSLGMPVYSLSLCFLPSVYWPRSWHQVHGHERRGQDPPLAEFEC